MDSTIHCCLAFQTVNSQYYRHAAVTMLSCMHNTTLPIHFHVVTEGLSPDCAEILKSLCQGRADISFYSAPRIPASVAQNLPPQFGIGCLYVCALHECLTVDKLVYLDCDVISQRNIADLFSLDLQGKSMAAVPDVNLHRHSKDFAAMYQRLDLSLDTYVNSGVLVMDLDKLRKLSAQGNIFWKAHTAAQKQWPSWSPLFPDQDLINLALSKHADILHLDESYNWLVNFRKRRFCGPEEYQGKILHYAGLKPWNAVFPAATAYWIYEAQSPWGAEGLMRLAKHVSAPELELAWYALRHKGTVQRLRKALQCLGMSE